MLFETSSAAVFGIDAYLVEVEVGVGPGQAGTLSVVGLPDNAVRESRERIKAPCATAASTTLLFKQLR